MTTIIILIAIYILSAIGWWLLVHKFEEYPKPWMAVVTFIPFVNLCCIIAAFIGLIHEIINDFIKDNVNPKKFFKIK